MQKKLFIFDLDSTLLDTLKYWYKILNKDIFKHYNKKGKLNIQKMRRGLNNKEASKLFIDVTGINVSQEEVEKFWEQRAIYYYLNKAKMIKGVKQFLEKLKSKGYKLVLATATAKPAAKFALERFDLLKYFDEIFTECDFDSTKTKSNFWEQLFEKLGYKYEDAILFEDSFGSLKCAHEQGIDTCALLHSLNKCHHEDMKKMCLLTIKNYKDKKLNEIF